MRCYMYGALHRIWNRITILLIQEDQQKGIGDHTDKTHNALSCDLHFKGGKDGEEPGFPIRFAHLMHGITFKKWKMSEEWDDLFYICC